MLCGGAKYLDCLVILTPEDVDAMAEAVDGRDMLLSEGRFCGQYVSLAPDRRCSPGIVATSVNGMTSDSTSLSSEDGTL